MSENFAGWICWPCYPTAAAEGRHGLHPGSRQPVWAAKLRVGTTVKADQTAIHEMGGSMEHLRMYVCDRSPRKRPSLAQHLKPWHSTSRWCVTTFIKGRTGSIMTPSSIFWERRAWCNGERSTTIHPLKRRIGEGQHCHCSRSRKHVGQLCQKASVGLNFGRCQFDKCSFSHKCYNCGFPHAARNCRSSRQPFHGQPGASSRVPQTGGNRATHLAGKNTGQHNTASHPARPPVRSEGWSNFVSQQN